MPSQLSANLKDVLTAAAAVQSFSSLVSYTPDLDLSLVFGDPDAVKSLADALAADSSTDDGEQAMRAAQQNLEILTTHLTAAKALVGTWKSDILPATLQIANDVQGYQAEVAALQQSIATQLSNLANLTGPQLAQALSGLSGTVQALQGGLGTRITEVAGLETQLATFAQRLTGVASDFDSDWSATKTLITSERGVIDAIGAAIADLNAKLKTDIGLLAGGAATAAIGIGLIVGGVVAILASGGSANVPGGVAIAAGVVLLAGGGAMMGVGGAALPDIEAQLTHLTQDLSIVQQLLSHFTTAQQHLTDLDTSATNASHAVTSLKQYYDTLQQELAAIRQPLDRAAADLNQPGGGSTLTPQQVQEILDQVQAEIGNVATEWADAAADATLLENILSGVTSNVVNQLAPAA